LQVSSAGPLAPPIDGRQWPPELDYPASTCAVARREYGKVSESMTERQATRLNNLERQHRGLDAALEALTRRAYLTPVEQETARELKKRKLNAKDRIAALKRMLGD
jgi:hypothetical protein